MVLFLSFRMCHLRADANKFLHRARDVLFSPAIKINTAGRNILVQTEIAQRIRLARVVQNRLADERGAETAACSLIRGCQLIQLQPDVRMQVIPCTQPVKARAGVIALTQRQKGKL